MAANFFVERNAGHPWSGAVGYDLLYLNADSESELESLVQAATKKFWSPWMIGTNTRTQLPGGLMYKPSGATMPWRDPIDQ